MYKTNAFKQLEADLTEIHGFEHVNKCFDVLDSEGTFRKAELLVHFKTSYNGTTVQRYNGHTKLQRILGRLLPHFLVHATCCFICRNRK